MVILVLTLLVDVQRCIKLLYVLIADLHVDLLGVGSIRSFTRPPNANDAPMRVLDR